MTAHPDPTSPSSGLDARADLAVKARLRTLSDALLRHEAALLAGELGETLHDYRVAVRRIRSLLGQFSAVFSERRAQRFREGFARLARLTSPARDLEVCVAGFAGGESTLEPARCLLEARLEAARARLLRHVATVRHRHFMESWLCFLESPASHRAVQPLARNPIGDVAAKRIRKLRKRAVREGRAIGSQSPPEALHALRKTCKKLRYVLEFYRGLAPSGKIDRLVRDLKALQEILGDYQDGAVHAALLHELAGALPRRNTSPDQSAGGDKIAGSDFGQRSWPPRGEPQGGGEQFAREAPGGGRAGIARHDKPAGQPVCTAEPPEGCRAGIVRHETLLALGARLAREQLRQEQARASFQRVFHRFASDKEQARYRALFRAERATPPAG